MGKIVPETRSGYNLRMDINRLFAYAENTRHLLHETLAAHPVAWEQPFETIALYSTIQQLVGHMVGAEQRWTEQRLYARPRPPRYEDQPPVSLEQSFTDWDSVRAPTLAYAESADDAALARLITTELPQWNETVSLTAEEVLFHIVNHQMWHLGQVSMALQRLGIDPPNFDYPLLRPR